MARGENIFKRKDGRWEARYIKGYELSGKIRYGFCYGKTYREAKEKVLKYKTAVAEGKALPTGSAKNRFSFYCDGWLELRRTKVRESTYVKYDTILKKHIKPGLGACLPLAITAGVIDDFSGRLLSEEGLSAKSVHDVLVVLKSILKYTASFFSGIFPNIEISYPKERKKEMRVLSLDEQKLFAEYLLEDTDPCKFGVLLSLFTGMRIGELCALKWENISVNERSVRVASTMQRLRDPDAAGTAKTKIVIGAPKSDTSARTIPLTEGGAELCRRMDPNDQAAYVLTGTGEYMEPRALQYRIRKYTRECGLEGVHCHTLRHSHASLLVEMGFSPLLISERLGHENIQTTLQTYSHLYPDKQEEVSSRLESDEGEKYSGVLSEFEKKIEDMT